jgi:hypothetical protein
MAQISASCWLIGASAPPRTDWLLRDSPPRSDCRFAWAAYVTYTRKHPSLPWILGITALLFNPFIKIHTSKEAWSRVNVASAILLLTTKAQFQTT